MSVLSRMLRLFGQCYLFVFFSWVFLASFFVHNKLNPRLPIRPPIDHVSTGSDG